MIPAIEISGLSKTFGSGRKKSQVLYDLSLTVPEREVFGFLGPNGAGKSTTIKLILGFLRPTSGTIRVLGHTLGKDEFRSNIGYLSESPIFYSHLSARETLLLSGRLSNVPSTLLRQRIPEILEKLNLLHAIDRRVRDFSKGMKQRLGMANALVHDPQVLIFDEPMSGLDPLGRHMIKGLFEELRSRGKTIFFSSHILSDIEELCDEVAIVHKGLLLFSGGLTDFLQGERLEGRFVDIIREVEYA